MSVLIKGMEMPNCCTRCDYLGLNVAIGCPVMTGENGRATDCPLIEVPLHGRLIDADALMNDGWTLHKQTMWMGNCATHVISLDNLNVPTVIPADKDGEA